jgi:tRNA A-37 threonylcarbamoyl transferase component Bud32/pimeloyl-ACP methyl ester carboxylesterase
MPDIRELLENELGSIYSLERELAAGGMSRVFLAEERRLGRKVVLKVLAPELAEGVSAQRFLREIQMAARLQQANIVPLLTSGEVGSVAYYTMPFIDGQSLREVISAGPVALPLAVSILRDIMRALAYAHAEGVVHRDVKPENVLLSGDTAVVTDFGIAKALAVARMSTAAVTLTQLGTTLGTPAYMAPEQAAGDDVDHRADIHAWGLVAYELLAGVHPFGVKRSAQAYIAAQLTEIPRPLTQLSPDCPGELDRLILSCLEKDPAHRPQSARDVLTKMDTATAHSRRTQPRTIAAKHKVTTRGFKLTDDVCRRVDRTLLDPRIIGGEMKWLDNSVASDTLVVCIHGTGLDGEMFRNVLENLPYRVAAPTFFGFESDEQRRVPLTLEAHMALVRELVKAVMEEIRPRRMIMLGFSSGGDVVMRLLAHPASGGIHCNAAVTLGANLGLETCWITRRLAHLYSYDEGTLLEDLKTIAMSAGSVHEWLNVHEYLVRVLRKFQHDVEPLRVVASGFARPFEDEGRDVFPGWYRAVTSRIPVLICVNEDDSITRALIQELRLRNLDSGILGPRYIEDSLRLEPDADHFDLLALPRVERYLADAISRLELGPS